MLKNKRETGITLVALVITITVVLIIAAVAIVAVQNEGIIEYAKNAAEKYEIGQIQEEAEIVKDDAKIEYSISGRTLTQADLLSRLQQHFEGSTIEGNSVLVKNGKYKIVVDENANISVEGNAQREYARGDVKVSHTVNKTNSGYNIILTMELVGMPRYDYDELAYNQYLENEYLPGMSTEELMVMGGELLYPGEGLTAKQVYEGVLMSELDGMSYEDFMKDKDAIIKDKYNFPTANSYIKFAMIQAFTGSWIDAWDVQTDGANMVYSKLLLPELVGKSEDEIKSAIEGYYNNEKTFDVILKEITGKTTIEDYILKLNREVDIDIPAAKFFNREQALIYLAGQAYAKSHPIVVTKPDGTVQQIDWFGDYDGLFGRTYTVTEIGSYTIKVTGPSGYTEQIVAKAGASITLDKEEITIVDKATITATLINLNESDLVWTTSDDNIASIEGTGATVKVIAKSVGTATITATCGEYTATCEVKIEGSIVLDKEEMAIQDKATITATLINLNENDLIWTISNENIASIEGIGTTVNVIAKSVGTATITVTCGEYTAQCIVGVLGKVDINEIAQINSTIDGKIYSSTNPIIPAGFKAINTETSHWDAESGPEVEDGLVIQDEVGNEFVWIPVNNLNAFARPIAEGSEDYRGVLYDWTKSGYPEYSWSANSTSAREPDVTSKYDGSYLSKMGVTTDLNKDGKVDIIDAKEMLQKEFNNMVRSIDEYGGFYVGRYEMSYNVSAQSKKSTETNPITSSSAYYINTNMWYGLYSKAKTYTNVNNSVQSSMIWGCQYDAMITWIGSAAHTDIGDNRNKTDETGSVETDKLKNIYDLYGNRYEWTLETRGNEYRVRRGGYYNNSYSPSRRDTYQPSVDMKPDGSRLSLYIKVQE